MENAAKKALVTSMNNEMISVFFERSGKTEMETINMEGHYKFSRVDGAISSKKIEDKDRPSVSDFLDFELMHIVNPDIRTDVIKALDKAPDYFIHVPASSSGKYHPIFSLGEGGLLRHTKAVARIAIKLWLRKAVPLDWRNYWLELESSKRFDIDNIIETMSETDFEYCLAACMLHDLYKQGTDDLGYHQTCFEHPLIAAEQIRNNTDLSVSFRYIVPELIKTHMGQWTTATYSEVTLPSIENKLQVFVHLCDYIASRKNMKIVDMKIIDFRKN